MYSRLEEVRKNNGLSKKDFSLKLEITEQTYQNYSTGKRIIPTDVALKVKHLFDISLDWLLDGEEKVEINYKVELLKMIKEFKPSQIEYLYHIAKSKKLEIK